MLYIFGHKSPDTDSICASLAYAYLKNEIGEEAKPYRLGAINKETELVLNRFGMNTPPLLKDASKKDVVLLDHNEFYQSADGIEDANIVEIIDHHKVNFKWSKPIYILTMPVGSTSTIIARKFFWKDVRMPREIAGILLSAIISDTVIFRSPTTTEMDREVAERLKKIAGIEDPESWGVEMFKAGSQISEKSARELIYYDYKIFDFNGKRVLINQLQVVDDSEVMERKEELMEEMRKIKEKDKLFGVVLLVTDIMKGGSALIVVADDPEPFEKALKTKLKNGTAWLEGVMSRKKQVVPPLEQIFLKKHA